MVFEDVGDPLVKACELDTDMDAVYLARAAQIVCCHSFREDKPFNGFPEGCQEESVPPLLLVLVNMAIESPSIKDQMEESTLAALATAQMLKFNSIKHQ